MTNFESIFSNTKTFKTGGKELRKITILDEQKASQPIDFMRKKNKKFCSAKTFLFTKNP